MNYIIFPIALFVLFFLTLAFVFFIHEWLLKLSLYRNLVIIFFYPFIKRRINKSMKYMYSHQKTKVYTDILINDRIWYKKTFMFERLEKWIIKKHLTHI